MFYPLEKILGKPYGGGGWHLPTHNIVRPRVKGVMNMSEKVGTLGKGL